MSHPSETLIKQIKARRAALGLSQRALSERSGLTQAHISQIERGRTDPSISSLIQLARSLGLEVALVPKKVLPAVEGIVAGAIKVRPNSDLATQSAEVAKFERLVKKQRQLCGSSTALDRIDNNLHVLRFLPMRSGELTVLQQLHDALKGLPATPQAALIVREVAAKLQSLRNGLVHGREANEPRPAYVFDDEADDA